MKSSDAKLMPISVARGRLGAEETDAHGGRPAEDVHGLRQKVGRQRVLVHFDDAAAPGRRSKVEHAGELLRRGN
eukprot:5260002-Pyramimonas_sp.AAC.1